MRIALVTDTYRPQVNGVTTVTHRIAELLDSSNHQVATVAPSYPDQAEADGPGSELRIPSVSFPPYPEIRLSWPSFRSVARFLDRFQPELVHVATEGPLGFVGRSYALRHRVPLFTSFHTNFPQYARHYGAAALEPLVWRWLVRFHSPAVITHTPGEAVKDELVRRGITRATVWGRGVDISQFNPTRRARWWRESVHADDDTTVILHAGRLAAEKNLDVLIQAWKLARDPLGHRAVFVIAGDGPLAARIDAELPWVRRAGFLSRDTLATVYASSDLCVLPSDTETCGLVALEALASGTPVIAANAGGLRETIQEGENGALVPAHDPSAFAARIIELTIDTRRRHALSRGARNTALERDAEVENEVLLRQYAAALNHPASSEATCAA